MTQEEKILELETKLNSLHDWASRIVKRIEDLESPAKPNIPQKWSTEEENYLWEEARLTPNLTDALHALANQWSKLFGKKRTYISLRKKFNRLKELHQ